MTKCVNEDCQYFLENMVSVMKYAQIKESKKGYN